MNSIELQFTYSELFSDAIPKIEDELAKLNMHKSVSIICELIRAIGYILEPIDFFGNVITISFEMVLKKMLLHDRVANKEELFADDFYITNIHSFSCLLKVL